MTGETDSAPNFVKRKMELSDDRKKQNKTWNGFQN